MIEYFEKKNLKYNILDIFNVFFNHKMKVFISITFVLNIDIFFYIHD